jgi:hypothetical protein
MVVILEFFDCASLIGLINLCSILFLIWSFKFATALFYSKHLSNGIDCGIFTVNSFISDPSKLSPIFALQTFNNTHYEQKIEM